jgi:hypothetical protein
MKSSLMRLVLLAGAAGVLAPSALADHRSHSRCDDGYRYESRNSRYDDGCRYDSRYSRCDPYYDDRCRDCDRYGGSRYDDPYYSSGRYDRCDRYGRYDDYYSSGPRYGGYIGYDSRCHDRHSKPSFTVVIRW